MRGWGRDWPDSIPVDGAGGSLRSPRGTGWRYRTQPGDTRGLGWREFTGTLGWPAGSVPEGCRQTGCGIACSRARAQLNFSAQGQRSGRCRVRRRADRVRRPAREKTRHRRVLVVTIRSPRPAPGRPVGQVMRHHLDRQPGGVGGETARLRDLRSLGILENPRVGGFT